MTGAADIDDLGGDGSGFRAVIERLPDAVLIHRDGLILYANPAATVLFGYAEGREMVGIEVKTVMAPGAFASHAPRHHHILETGEPSPWMERSVPMPDGTAIDVEVCGTRVVFGGAPAILALLRNVSERRALIAKMMQMDRAISAGTLAAGVGHEINNPLAYVSANLEWLEERLRAGQSRTDGVVDDEVLSVLEDCRHGARRIRDIVRGLQTFAKADEPRATPVDIFPSIEDAVSMAANEVKHRAEVVRDYGDAAVVEAHSSRLTQVFLNLILNAAHAIREGARAENVIRITTSTDERSVLISISDTGKGIAPADLPRIFDPFFTTRPVGEGTGLGLAICREIVTNLRGEITAVSPPGQGATFHVRLPLAAREAAAPVVPESTRRGRVLVVDDEHMLGSVFARILGADHEVVFLEGGRAAIELLDRGETFDAIFLDLMMAEVSGMDVYAHVAAHHPALLTRIIVMTGGAYTPAARELVDKLPTLPLRKPIDVSELRERVRALLGGPPAS